MEKTDNQNGLTKIPQKKCRISNFSGIYLLKQYRELLLFASLNIMPIFATYAVETPEPSDLLFRVSFTKGLNADFSRGSAVAYSSSGLTPTDVEEGKTWKAIPLRDRNWLMYSGENNFNPQEGTVLMWCKSDPKANGYLMSAWEQGKGGFCFFVYEGRLLLRSWKDGKSENLLSQPIDIKKWQNEWHEVGFSYDLPTEKVQIIYDGKVIAKGEMKNMPELTGTKFKIGIGCYVQTGKQQFNGLIGEIKMFSSFLKYSDPTPNVNRLNMLDFSDAGKVAKYCPSKGVSYRTVQDKKLGKPVLEITVQPFSEHQNKWPLLWITSKALGCPFDLSNYSKIEFTIKKTTEGLAQFCYMLVSPLNPDSGRNIDRILEVIPGGTEMTSKFSLTGFVRPCNDPSVLNMIGIGFPESAKTEVYRLISVEAVKDEASGTIHDQVVQDVKKTQVDLEILNQLLKKADKTEVNRLGPELKLLDTELKEIEKQTQASTVTGFEGQYNPLRKKLRDIANKSGKIFIDLLKKEFFVWEHPDALPLPQDIVPRASSKATEAFELQMAQGEYRDITFLVSAAEKPLSLQIKLDGSDELTGSCDIFSVDFFKYEREKVELAEFLRPVKGPVVIPAGETREIRLRFNGDSGKLTAGKYDFSVSLCNNTTGFTQSIPGKLTMWDFKLYPMEKLDNNGYARFNSHNATELAGQADSLKEMKRYGMNFALIEVFVVGDVKFDKGGNLTSFNTSMMDLNIRNLKRLWDTFPGKQHLTFYLFLPMSHIQKYLPKFGTPAYYNALAQWVRKISQVMESYGIGYNDYYVAIGDEASLVGLMNYAIPAAEAIKKLNPDVHLFQNASQIFDNDSDNQRYLELFDHFEPAYDLLIKNKNLYSELKKSGKPLSTYKCNHVATLNGDIYDYYRLYAWRAFQLGINSLGLWTFNSWNELYKPANNYGIGYQMIGRNADGSISVARRYHLYRDGINDLRYLLTLQELAAKLPEKKTEINAFIDKTVHEVLRNKDNLAGAEAGRKKIAMKILELQNNVK